MAIGDKNNSDDVFFRDLTISVLANLQDKIKWVNRFSSGNVDVTVPFYYSLTGSEDFLLDTFVDDISSTNRLTELNTDAYPRAHITLTSTTVKSDEFANPNVWMRSVVENDDEIRNILSKVRAIPLQVTYDVTILLNSELDVFKAQQSIYNLLWLYQYIYFEYNFMNIDAQMVTPDDFTLEINREKSLDSGSNDVKLTFSIDVHTYYPAINIEHSIEPVPVYWGVNINSANVVNSNNPMVAGDWTPVTGTGSNIDPPFFEVTNT